MTKSSPPIWHVLHNVKSMVKISSIFVAFLENMNFTFLEKNALIFSLVTWDPNYYNSLQRPSKIMARFFPKVLDFQVLSRLHLSPSPRRLFFSWNGSSSSILIQCDLNKNLGFNVTQFKEIFRHGQNTQFCHLQLREDLITIHHQLNQFL